MTDIATLGLEINSRGAANASRDLDKLSVSAGKAKQGFANLAKVATGALAGLVSIQGLTVAARGALEFGSAVSELGTLLDGNAQKMDAAGASARELAKTYGGRATDQVKSFYQAISAGAESVSEAQDILDQANKLAIGGVSNVTTGVDILTTAINSYGRDVITAEQASDALFVGMKAGKTTITELASSLGNVIPMANAMGVSFDETVAATAALTTQGITTSQAVTGLRASLVAVSGPTNQAQKLAHKLGLEFSTSALKAKGLEGFLQDVIEKTGGSADAMRELFGSVEATTAVLALAGGGSEKLTSILEDMTDKAGAAQAAFDVMSEDMGQRWSVQMAKLADAAITVGAVVLSVAVPAVEAFTGAIEAIGPHMSSIIGVATALSVAITAKLAFSMGSTLVAGAVSAVSSMVALEMAMGATSTASALSSIAVKGFSAALVGLRAALLYTGIGAVVVGAGLLIGRFIDLYNEAGSFAGAWRLAVERTSARFTAIEHTVAAWGLNVRATFLDASAALLRGFDGALSSVKQYFADTAANISGSMAAGIGTIVGAIKSIPDAASAAMAEFRSYIVDGIGNTISAAVAKATELKNAINKALRGTGAGGVNVINNAPQGYSEKSPGRTLGLSSGGSSSEIQNYLSGGSGSGKVDGGAGFDTLGVAAGAAYGEGFQTGVKKALDINSPSKVGELIGGDFSDGVEGGAGADTVGARMGADFAQSFDAQASRASKAATDLEISAGNLRARAMAHTAKATAAYEKLAKPVDAAAASVDGLAKRTHETTDAVGGVTSAAEDAVAKFKEAGSAGGGAFEAITAKAKKAKAEVAKLDGTLSTVFDAMGKGDLSGIGSTLLDKSSSAFSGLLKSSFTPGKDGSIAGLSGIFSGLKSSFTGITSAFSSGMSAAGGGLSGIISGVGGAISAAMPLVGAASFLINGFKKKTELLDAGLQVQIDGTNTLAESYKKVKETRFWGLSKKTKETYDAASDAVQSAVSDTVGMMRGSVLEQASVLGLAATALDGFTASLKLSTKDMTEEQATAALTAELEGLSDQMALTAMGTSAYVAIGETASDTLARLSSALSTVNPAMATLGLNLHAVSVAGGAAASDFAELFGGIDAFSTAASAYYEAFYSDAEKLANTTQSVTDLLASLSISTMPATLAQFRMAVEAFDDAGDTDAVAKLMQIAPAFAQIADDAEAAAIALQAAVNPDNYSSQFEFLKAQAMAAGGIGGASPDFDGDVSAAISTRDIAAKQAAQEAAQAAAQAAATAAAQAAAKASQIAGLNAQLGSAVSGGVPAGMDPGDYRRNAAINAAKAQSLRSQIRGLGGIPSYDVGTDYHPGGLAYVHKDEMINLPRGSSVSTVSQTNKMLDSADVVTELKALRAEVTLLRSSASISANKLTSIANDTGELVTLELEAQE